MVLAVLALALACVNVAALLVERSSSREKEIAVRLSLGAGRASLVRQCLTETLLLAAIGGAAGLIVAPWAADVLTTAQPGVLEIDTSLDVRVFLFGLAAAGLSGLLVGLAPILASNRIGLADVARHVGGTAAGGRRRPTLHDLVVTCQLAISLIMLIGAALLVQSVRNFSSADPGFRAEDVLLAGAHPATAGYDGARLDTFWRETLDRVGRVRGVQSASLARLVPLAPGGQRQRLINPASGEAIEIDTNAIAPAYFRTLAIPLLEGRDFSERDGQGSTRVMIVNERMARMFWPGQDPVGKRIRLGRTNGPVCEVIAVAKDVKYRRLGDEPAPMLYIPIYQSRSSDPMTLHIRSSGDARDLVPAIRREMQALDANVPIFEMRTLADQLNASFAQTRQAAALTSAFGMLALLLSGIGVYGVTALAVGRRTRDIGIRRALGARPRHIASVVSRRGLVLVVVGVGLGVLGGIAFTPLAASLLYGVAAGDRATFAVMSALLAAVSLIAIGIPARAAARLDPAAAIRHE
jgi:predicted permease